jgi:hypothetical protein
MEEKKDWYESAKNTITAFNLFIKILFGLIIIGSLLFIVVADKFETIFSLYAIGIIASIIFYWFISAIFGIVAKSLIDIKKLIIDPNSKEEIEK